MADLANSGPNSKYLKLRPSTTTLPPSDERMSRAQRWTAWTLRKNPDDPKKKPSKVPTSDPTNPNTWGYYHALRTLMADQRVAGLGFEMYGRPGVLGIDIDNCVDEFGNRTPIAQQLLAILESVGGQFHVELSPSAAGIRIFAAETPLPFHDYTNKDHGIEVYTGESGRFLAFTGARIPEFAEVKGPFQQLPQAAVEFLGKFALKWKEGAAREGAVPASEPVPDLPELSRRDDWQKLHPNALKRLPKEMREFLEYGSLGRKYASASEQLFAAEQALLKTLKPEQAYQILISAEGTWGIALEHREGKADKAKAFIWDDLQRAKKSAENFAKDKAAQEYGWKECDIQVTITEDGARAKFILLNVINAFQKHGEWLNRLGYNVFDGRASLDKKDLELRHLAEMGAWLVEFLHWDQEPFRDMLENAVIEAAKTRPWNPIEDELRGLVWDGRNRLEQFAEAVSDGSAIGGLKLDVEILRKWLVGFVARGLTPGCQMDTVLCLTEKEGGGFKTSLARVLSGGRFTDTPGFSQDRDTAMLREGMRIIELGEGAAVKRSDRHALKLDLSKTEDLFRRPWGRGVEKRPRGFVYILTANDQAMLRSDQDGLRRIWPIYAKARIDIEWVKENREQLLAQAVALFDKGTPWWWSKEEEPAELRARQLAAVAEDFTDAAVETIIADPENAQRGYTTLGEVKKAVEALTGTALSLSQSQHVVEALLRHGFTSEQRRVDGRKLRVWHHPNWRQVFGVVLQMKRPDTDSATH